MKSIKNVNIDLEELKKEKEKNFKDRLKFIDWWIEYMKNQTDEEWSKQQNKVVDSQVN